MLQIDAPPVENFWLRHWWRIWFDCAKVRKWETASCTSQQSDRRVSTVGLGAFRPTIWMPTAMQMPPLFANPQKIKQMKIYTVSHKNDIILYW